MMLASPGRLAARGSGRGGPRRCRPHVAIAALGALLVTGCAGGPLRHPLPPSLATQAEPPGMPRVRFWGDETPAAFAEWASMSDPDFEARHAALIGQPHRYLVLSGGGAEGAFGAGLLAGWSREGSRPQFQIVTGISTGAIAAPFAFLGSRYDEVLREIYTRYGVRDLVEIRSIFGILRGDAAASTVPLRRLLARYIDDSVVAAIAAEGRKGRSLYVGTTNLDAGRPVIWDITRMAASAAPGAADLIRDVILASASIPGAFSPVIIPVQAQGRRYDEMHVDGGVTAQLFLAPGGIDWKRIAERLRLPGPPEVYIIRNARLMPEREPVPRRLLPIMGRTVATLIRRQGIGDLAQVYLLAARDGLGFNLAYVPRISTSSRARRSIRST